MSERPSTGPGAHRSDPRGQEQDATSLPDSGLLAIWLAAYLAGEVSPDDVRDAVVGEDAAHHVVGLGQDPGEAEALILALGTLRRLGATGVTLALPVPGDPLGLGGPPPFNAEALEIEEAVLLPGAGVGLLPRRAGAGVVWQVLPANPAAVPHVAEADQDLRRVLTVAATTLADLEVARWRPDVADALLDLRRDLVLPLPSSTDARTARLLGSALRCRRIVELALADDGGSVTASEAQQRREALAPLERASRRGLVAACSRSADH